MSVVSHASLPFARTDHDDHHNYDLLHLYEQFFGNSGSRVVLENLECFSVRDVSNCVRHEPALLISLVFGRRVINALRYEHRPAKFAKKVRIAIDSAIRRHGGLLLMASVIIRPALGAVMSVYVWVTFIATVRSARSVSPTIHEAVKRRSLGLTGKPKLTFQFHRVRCMDRAFVFTRYFETKYSLNLSIPFFKETGCQSITPRPLAYLALM